MKEYKNISVMLFVLTIVSCDGSNASLTLDPLTAPVFKTSLLKDNAVDVSWSHVPNASHYEIYRHTNVLLEGDVLSEASKLASPSASVGPSYMDSGVAYGTKYYYWMKACNYKGCSNLSQPVTLVTYPSVSNSNITGKQSDKSIKISWQVVPGSSSYRVYKSTSNNPSESEVLTSLEASSGLVYTDEKISAGINYYYWLKACNSSGCSAYSEPFGLMVRPSPPVLEGEQNASTANLTWKNSAGTDYYELYKSRKNTPSTDLIASRFISSRSSYQDGKNSAGIAYHYWLKACNSGGCSDYSDALILTRKPSLNDTGITCTKKETDIYLDCNHGRDAQARAGDLVKVGSGKAGFDLTKLDKNGNAVRGKKNWSCVRDNVTGLVWQARTMANADSPDITKRLNAVNQDKNPLCGYKDWRLPVREELTSIADYGGAAPSLDSAYFFNKDFVFTASGIAEENAGDVTLPIRLVRGESLFSVAVDKLTIDKNLFTDLRTGLMWKRCAEGLRESGCTAGEAGAYTWAQATNLVDASNSTRFANYENWRIPNLKELASLTAIGRLHPRINGFLLVNNPSGDFWSSSLDAASVDSKYLRLVRDAR